MSTNRWIQLFVLVALVLTFALTVREAVATSAVVSQSSSARRSSIECASLPSRYSIHDLYVEEIGAWVTFSEDGPTGVDGGLPELLSYYRTCSR
jgi:hypothetical protein